ncbi:hypothetical protein AV530_009728 [Patagioenas fasciata monilis]|uniref:LIM domain only protein 3 n=1 Tax=Patagioenas fasciata monilis TaxID=372326 RepID=A0A1V4JHH0_PATFA|nr:hypothetical protein AV530_009728 [Patagioenas fasciata monilis]
MNGMELNVNYSILFLYTCGLAYYSEKSYKAATVLIELPPLYRLIEKVYKCSQSSQTPSRKALDKYWHEDCLKCACCDCRLGEVGSTLYTKANLILCRRDYLRLFGVTGNCAACSKLIPAFEMVMRAKDNVYHLDCFACQLCNQRFCVGDKFFLKNNMILCQTDYEEGLMKEGYAPQVLKWSFDAFRPGRHANISTLHSQGLKMLGDSKSPKSKEFQKTFHVLLRSLEREAGGKAAYKTILQLLSMQKAIATHVQKQLTPSVFIRKCFSWTSIGGIVLKNAAGSVRN